MHNNSPFWVQFAYWCNRDSRSNKCSRNFGVSHSGSVFFQKEESCCPCCPQSLAVESISNQGTGPATQEDTQDLESEADLTFQFPEKDDSPEITIQSMKSSNVGLSSVSVGAHHQKGKGIPVHKMDNPNESHVCVCYMSTHSKEVETLIGFFIPLPSGMLETRLLLGCMHWLGSKRSHGS